MTTDIHSIKSNFPDCYFSSSNNRQKCKDIVIMQNLQKCIVKSYGHNIENSKQRFTSAQVLRWGLISVNLGYQKVTPGPIWQHR